MGSLQALQAVKILLGIGEPAAGQVLFFDALPGEFKAIRVSRDPTCPLCGDAPTITPLI
jgi:adenylyltransferase/sulfurtransferase